MSDPSASQPERQRPRPVEEPPPPQGMELRELVNLLLAGKWWIAGFTALGLALGLAYAFLATPTYRADAMLQIQQQNSTLSTLSSQNDILSALLGANTQAQAEIQIMTSRAVLDPVIRNLALYVTVKGVPFGRVRISKLDVPASWYDETLKLRAEGGGAYTLLDPDGRQVLTGRVGEEATGDSGRVKIEVSRLDLEAGKSATVVRQPVQEAFKRLSKRVSAAELGQNTGIVQLSLEGAHPVHVRNVLNALVNQYLAQNVAAYSAQARRSLEFVDKQLPALKQQMNAAESKLTAYQVSHNTVNIDEQAKALLQEFNTLEGELSQLEIAQAALGQQYTSKYPAYVAMQRQKRSVSGKIATLESQLKQLPKDEQGYVRLKRDAEVYTTLYTTLLGQKQDLAIASAGAVGSARTVDEAVTPLRPIKPDKSVAVALGLLLGLGVGVSLVFLRRAMSRGLTDPMEIERRFGMPLYAVVPRSGREDRLRKRRNGGRGAPTVLAQLSSHDPAVEALRSLRTSLDFALRDAKNRVVALTGPAPGVGKSFVAANLAYLAAAAGRKTLLVDCDLRRGHLHKYLGRSASPGVAELLAGSADLSQCLVAGLLDTSLDFIPTGTSPPNPAELFLKHDIGGLLERVAEGYDLVLVDLPPLLSVADPVIAMRTTGVNLVILKAARHASREIAYALTRLQQNGISVAGFLLNDLTRQSAGYGYTYGYRYE